VVNSKYGPISHSLAVILIGKSFFTLFVRAGGTCCLKNLNPFEFLSPVFTIQRKIVCQTFHMQQATIGLSCTTGQLYT
jgi:hypothetical protein